MTISVYSATGQKTGTRELPASLFAAPINTGLIHQAVLMQEQNARTPVAHVKRRGEVEGSTKKVYSQKHTGNARRGPIRSPLMRGGGKAWGPRNTRTFSRSMPQEMRHAALRASLSLQAKNGTIVALENYGNDVKTKTAHALLTKMSIALGRRVLVVLPAHQVSIEASMRNIPGIKTILASYLNPRDVVLAKHLIFVADAVEKAEAIFAKKNTEKTHKADNADAPAAKKAPAHKKATLKSAAKKAASKKSS